MSTVMVKLRPSHRRAWPVFHELLNKAPAPLSKDEIDKLRPGCQAACEKARTRLVLGHLAMLRHTVGRYLCHWPVTRRLVDEMVSAGLYALVRAVNRLSTEDWPKTLGHYLMNNICAEIEDEVARLRGVCPAAPSTNRRRVKKGEDPIFGEVKQQVPLAAPPGSAVTNSESPTLDTLDAVAHLQRALPRQGRYLDEEFWGLSDTEVAERLGVSRQTVQRNRADLLFIYWDLTRS